MKVIRTKDVTATVRIELLGILLFPRRLIGPLAGA
jgi:hypothetical protein